MVRISTVYDKTLNKKVFMVRGDEAYATRTDTLFEVIPTSDSYDSAKGYAVGISYDVLRDVGSSKISLYDGDELLAVYDWSSSSPKQYIGVTGTEHDTLDPTNCLYLKWNKEHKLYMKYKGNSSCLGSKSQPITINETVPSELETTVHITNIHLSNGGLVFTVSLDVGGDSTKVACQNQPIYVFLDGVEVGLDLDTGDNNSVTGTIPNITDGVHTLQVMVLDTDTLVGADKVETIDVGYELQVAKPLFKPFINGINNGVRVLLSDSGGNPVTESDVSFAGETEETNDNGYAFFNILNIVDGEYKASYESVDEKLYESEPFAVQTYNPTLSISGTPMVAEGGSRTLTVSLDQAYENIPIYVYDPSHTSHEDRSLVTESDGTKSFDVSPMRQDYTVKASVGTNDLHLTEKSMKIETVNAYIGRDYVIKNSNIVFDNCDVTTLSNYWSLRRKDNTAPYTISCRDASTVSHGYEFSFEIVSYTGIDNFKLKYNSAGQYVGVSLTGAGKYRIKWDGSRVYIYRNNSLVTSKSTTTAPAPYILFEPLSTSSSIVNIIDLKYKRYY